MLGCSEGADHSSRHYDNYPEHFVQLNVDTRRIWCYRLVLWCVIIQHYSALIAACSKSDATMRWEFGSSPAASVLSFARQPVAAPTRPPPRTLRIATGDSAASGRPDRWRGALLAYRTWATRVTWTRRCNAFSTLRRSQSRFPSVASSKTYKDVACLMYRVQISIKLFLFTILDWTAHSLLPF